MQKRKRYRSGLAFPSPSLPNEPVSHCKVFLGLISFSQIVLLNVGLQIPYEKVLYGQICFRNIAYRNVHNIYEHSKISDTLFCEERFLILYNLAFSKLYRYIHRTCFCVTCIINSLNNILQSTLRNIDLDHVYYLLT